MGRNTLFNIAGAVLQLTVALVSTPLYIRHIGTDRFGVLAIVWLFIGYFGLFDFGLGQATNSLVAKLHHARHRSSVFWTALAINAIFGMVGGTLLTVAIGLFFGHTKFSPTLVSEVRSVAPWLGLSVLVGVLSSILAGAIAGREQFLALSACTTFGTVAFTLFPLLISIGFGPDLRLLIPAAVFARLVGSLPLAMFAWRSVPLRSPQIDRRWLRPLFSFGGWVSVSNLLDPILSTLDRIVIATISGATAVTLYTVPFNLASRVLVIPSSVLSAIFPRFAKMNRAEIENLARRSLFTLNAIMTPLVVLGIFVMKGFLFVWVGQQIAEPSAPIGEIVLAGVWFNGMAYIPYAILNGTRRPGITAQTHLAEVIPFVAVLAIALRFGGVQGAAWAWTLRVASDAILLSKFSQLTRASYGPLFPSAMLIIISSIVAINLNGHPTLLIFAGTIAFLAASALGMKTLPDDVKARLISNLRALSF